MTRIHLRILFVLFLPWAVAVTAAETAYKWMDEDGTVHYGQEPPPDRQAEAIDLPQGPSEESLKEARQRQESIRRQANELADQRIRLESERLKQAERQQREAEQEEYERRLRELEEKADRAPGYWTIPHYPIGPGRPPGSKPPGTHPPGTRPPGINPPGIKPPVQRPPARPLPH